MILPGTSEPSDADTAPHADTALNADTRAPDTSANHAPANFKPVNQWSRQELDALFARRSVGGGKAAARPPDAPPGDTPSGDTPPNPETGE